jgi:hypothetical protein
MERYLKFLAGVSPAKIQTKTGSEKVVPDG